MPRYERLSNQIDVIVKVTIFGYARIFKVYEVFDYAYPDLYVSQKKKLCIVNSFPNIFSCIR